MIYRQRVFSPRFVLFGFCWVLVGAGVALDAVSGVHNGAVNPFLMAVNATTGWVFAWLIAGSGCQVTAEGVRIRYFMNARTIPWVEVRGIHAGELAGDPRADEALIVTDGGRPFHLWLDLGDSVARIPGMSRRTAADMERGTVAGTGELLNEAWSVYQSTAEVN